MFVKRSDFPFDSFNALDAFLADAVHFMPSKQSFPPYNVLMSKDGNTCTVEVAVAGFQKDEIDIEVTDGKLRIKGEIKAKRTGEFNVVYQGIAERNFQLDFRINNNFEGKSAEFNNGILQITLEKVSGFSKKLEIAEPQLLKG